MAKKKQRELSPISRSLVEKTAAIMGESSAAAQALRDADAYGGLVVFYTTGYSFVVEKLPMQDMRGGHDCEHSDVVEGACAVCHEPMIKIGGP